MSPLPNNQTPLLVDIPPVPVASPQRPKLKWLVLLLMMAIWVGLLGLLLVNRVRISDWWRLRNYQPPVAISHLADQDTMNDYARHLFYLNNPQLPTTVTSFREFCPENKDTIVLGCYHSGENGIYIYNVSDPTLAGVQQVTAAHETLHAVYARLSAKDRTYVNGLLEDYYLHGLRDPHVQSEIKIYKQTEPGAVMDEMHSTFGTEIANLPAPLEAYYQRYFAKRSVIVAFEQQYEGAFTSRQTAVTRDDQQLGAMKQQIDAQETALTTGLNKIRSDQSKLSGLLNAGQTAGYNAAIPAYNNEVDGYNGGVAALRSTISTYNQLVVARNLIAGQLTTLDNALDTRLTAQTPR